MSEKITKRKDEFEEDLKDELLNLKHFCDIYDKGNISIYKQMALTFRKIFYDSNSSTSLLSQLGIKKNIKLLSQCSGKSSIKGEIFFMGMGIIENGEYVPNFLKGAVKKYITVKDYLEEIVFIFEEKEYSRFDVFKVVADKDGGAHYDRELPEKYLLLKNISFKIPFIGVTLNNIVGTILRQMSFEILNSPDLKKYL